MSNQRYRQEEPAELSREDRLAQARLIIGARCAESEQCAAEVSQALAHSYLEHGGESLEIEIEGMKLVVQEGNIYRRQQIEYDTQMREYLEGKRRYEPIKPARAQISGATMVAASRQLDRLSARKQALIEDAELRLSSTISMERAAQRRRGYAGEQTAHAETKLESQAEQPEATPAQNGEGAATAAA